MIIFNLDETLVFNMGINIFSGIITLIIFYSIKKVFADTYDIQLLRKIAATTILVLLSDTIMWILNGRSGVFFRALSYMNLILYFIMQIAIIFWWLRYAWYNIFSQKMTQKKETVFVTLPFICLSLIVLISPINGWCFYLDEANYYHRGVLSALMSIIVLFYVLTITAAALVQCRKEILVDRKKSLLTIAFFTVPPILGGLLQVVFYGLSLVWPCVVISSLLLLLNKQSQAISQDALTGLNNRRSMEKVLRTYVGRQIRAVTLILLDINEFKYINDEYGHDLGDRALIQAANILRETFNGTSAFLARYGGDEFVIILPEGDEGAAREASQKIRNRFEQFSQTNMFPFPLSVSLGAAITSKETDIGIADLLKEADRRMYQDKALYHQRQSNKRAIDGGEKTQDEALLICN